jgi:hypothetical protein
VHHDEHAEHHGERAAVRADSATTPEPNTATSSSSRTGSVIGCDAFGATKAPQTTAASSGAPIPSSH